jgi:hypothetical protein
MKDKSLGFMNKKTVTFLIIIILILAGSGYYFFVGKKANVTMPIPVVTDQTANWITGTNTQDGFSFKYPADFFAVNQQPKILVGDCDHSVFPESCPNINNIVIADQAAGGGDINAIKSNLSDPNYWKNPTGEKLTINNVPYCLYQTSDAATMHVYNYYYYTTVVNNKCLVVNLNTSTTNCDAYLPLETGNKEQAKNYNDCVVTNKDQPNILSQIIATFKFADK